MIKHHRHTRAAAEKAKTTEERHEPYRKWTAGCGDQAGIFFCNPQHEVGGSEWDELSSIDPKKTSVFLSDMLAIQAILLLPGKSVNPKKRGGLFSNDFNDDGDVNVQRVPRGRPVVVEAHGRLWLLVYRHYYVFLGGELSKHVSWKLCNRNTQKDPGLTDGCMVGLVLMPGQDVSRAFRFSMHFHDKPSVLVTDEEKDDEDLDFEKAAALLGHHFHWKAARNSLVLQYHPDKKEVPDRYEIVELDSLGLDEKCSAHEEASVLQDYNTPAKTLKRRASAFDTDSDEDEVPMKKNKKSTSFDDDDDDNDNENDDNDGGEKTGLNAVISRMESMQKRFLNLEACIRGLQMKMDVAFRSLERKLDEMTEPPRTPGLAAETIHPSQSPYQHYPPFFPYVSSQPAFAHPMSAYVPPPIRPPTSHPNTGGDITEPRH